MQTFSYFYISGFTFDEGSGEASFFYNFDKKEFFEEKIFFYDTHFPKKRKKDISEFDSFLFPLSIMLGISYYKLSPTQNIIVESGRLDDNQKIFWEKTYTLGLGEFFYTNKIDFRNLCKFDSNSSKDYPFDRKKREKKFLLPIGGGKDSIVSSLLLGKNEITYTPFIFGKTDKIKEEQCKISNHTPLITKRLLSENLLLLTKTGEYYNGHIPITGIISFVSLCIAYLYDFSDIVFSNERSANIGNTTIYDTVINHQYSKSFEFENDFNTYKNTYITQSIFYYSLLRPWYEIKIAKYFTENAKKYFSTFSSCNKNFKISSNKDYQTRWCNSCAKCVFVYTILRPFLSKDEVIQIFGKELYEDNSLKDLFKEIWGIKHIKPFECVGEIEESRYATQLFLKQNPSFTSPILRIFVEYENSHPFPNYDSYLLGENMDESFLPQELKNNIKIL